MRTSLLASTIVLLGLTSTAEAHFLLIQPPQTSNDTVGGKGSPPCGPDTAAAATPTPVMGGHALTLKVSEFVRHGGFYRFALALKSRSELPVDNVVYDSGGRVLPPDGTTPKGSDGMSASAATEMPPVFPVIADNVWKHPQAGAALMFPNSMYPDQVVLPNVNCDRCVLQVIEFMTPHPFNFSTPPPGGGYFYHHCAELKITADPAMPIFDPNASNTDGGTTDAHAGDAGGGAGSSAGGAGGATTGSAGGSGGAEANGAAGETTAGTSGETGSTGMAGAGSAGSTGETAGAAGTGSSGSRSTGSSGGCSVGGTMPTGLRSLVGLALFGMIFRRRLSRSRSR